MKYPLRNDHSLLWAQGNSVSFQVDEELSLKAEEELVIVVMLMPVILALHHAKSNDRAVHLTERLIVPLILHIPRQREHVDLFEMREEDV